MLPAWRHPVDIIWLGDTASHDLLLTGAKAAHLGRLSALYRVPPGFSITAEAYRRAGDMGRLSPRLRDVLAAGYAALAERTGVAEPSVAVRSSAIDEDGPLASFAGQHDTYLNITGTDALIDAVERCWASARTEQVLAYRRQHGLPLDGVCVSVLVQQLVPVDVSAVMFSANPVSSSRDEVIVTASWGLGESIVGGTITPDSWIVRKDSLEIADQCLGSKERMTVAVPGGTVEVNVPRLMRGQASLTNPQVLEIARLGVSLEARMGWPVDVECAFAGDELYLLQCRPITTLTHATQVRQATPAVQRALIT